MKILCSGNDLAAAVNIVVRTTGCKHISLQAHKKTNRLVLQGEDRGKRMHLRIPAKVEMAGDFTVLPTGLLGVCARRKELELEINEDESHVVVTSGKYQAELPLLPFQEIAIDPPAEGTSLEVENMELKMLNSACSDAQLTAPYQDGAPQLPLLVRIGEKGTEVVSMDIFHVAVIRIGGVSREQPLDLMLPPGSLTAVTSVAGDSAYEVILSESTLYANNDQFTISLPMVQIESSGLTRTHAAKLRKSATDGEDSAIKATVNWKELQNILGNVYAVCEAGVPLCFKVGKGKVTVSLKTTFGSASETLDAECKQSGEFYYDPQLLSEVLAKVSGETVTLNFAERFLWVSQGNKARHYFGVCLMSATKKS